MSDAAVKLVRQMHLQRGDILIVNDYQLLDDLRDMILPIDFPIPIIFAPGGDLTKCDLQTLLNVIARVMDERTQCPDLQ